jgi:DhnA family fructose-bisphosphate aldolase class Ia
MNSVTYRLNEFIRPADRRTLILDTSAGLVLGVLPGLEDYPSALRGALPLVDGVVCSPGQIGHLNGRNRADAALLVRMDWSNTLRANDFVLPPSETKHLPILAPQDALDLGAAGMVASFLLGYEEEVEAACLKSTVRWALAGQTLGLPLVVEVRADGPRVSLPDKSVELGASYALEGGADVIVVPNPGRRSLEILGAFVSVPWLIKATRLESAAADLEEGLACGACGLWLDHTVFGLPQPAEALRALSDQLHAPVKG